MEKKDIHLQNFKQALASTIKSISEISDCNINFGEQARKKDNKSANLPEIKKLEKFRDFSSIRAKADSEALRLRYSNIDVFNLHKPKGNNAKKLYEIAEKIRYEKIGCDHFKGIRKNLFENQNKQGSKINPTESVFDNYLRSFLFQVKETKNSDNKTKTIRKNLDQNFKKNLEILKENLRNQEKFNQIISKIISKMDIEDKEIYEDTSEKEKETEPLSNQQQEESQSKLQSQKENSEFLDVDLSNIEELTEKNDENEKIDEIENLDGTTIRRMKKISSKSKVKYKIYTEEFDETIKAEDLEAE